jgi:hypothetical protein
MKTKNLLLIAAVGVVAYVLFMRKKKSSTPAATPAVLASKPLAPMTKDLRMGAGEAI